MSGGRFGLIVALLATACGTGAEAPDELAQLDRDLTGPASLRDPALLSALADPIMADPGLATQANADAVRPPPQPYRAAVPPDDAPPRAPVPSEPLTAAPAASADCPACTVANGALTLGELAARQGDPAIRACARTVGYSATWAARLPAAVPLYPDARVLDAAGADGCGLRLVQFTSAAPVQTLLDWYHTRTRRAGFATEHQAGGGLDLITGMRADAVYGLYLAPRPAGGTDARLVVRGG